MDFVADRPLVRLSTRRRGVIQDIGDCLFGGRWSRDVVQMWESPDGSVHLIYAQEDQHESYGSSSILFRTTEGKGSQSRADVLSSMGFGGFGGAAAGALSFEAHLTACTALERCAPEHALVADNAALRRIFVGDQVRDRVFEFLSKLKTHCDSRFA